MRLLVVEDDQPTWQVLSRLLKRAGHAITPVNNSAAAREAAAHQSFDTVISDAGLPDGTGIELMEHLRAAYGLCGIALSGYGMENDVQRSNRAGFAAHLVKPVDINELRGALRRLFQDLLLKSISARDRSIASHSRGNAPCDAARLLATSSNGTLSNSQYSPWGPQSLGSR